MAFVRIAVISAALLWPTTPAAARERLKLIGGSGPQGAGDDRDRTCADPPFREIGSALHWSPPADLKDCDPAAIQRVIANIAALSAGLNIGNLHIHRAVCSDLSFYAATASGRREAVITGYHAHLDARDRLFWEAVAKLWGGLRASCLKE